MRQILGEDALDLKKHVLKKDSEKYMDLREFFAAIDEASLDEEDEDGPEERPRGKPKK